MLTDLLAAERVTVRTGATQLSKSEVLSLLAELLAKGSSIDQAAVERVLVEREALQSTGIGDGVAIPHGALAEVDAQRAALLIVPQGIEFDAIDGAKVTLVFALVGPKRATGEHLKTLARISRVLRSRHFRERLAGAADGRAAFDMLAAEDATSR